MSEWVSTLILSSTCLAMVRPHVPSFGVPFEQSAARIAETHIADVQEADATSVCESEEYDLIWTARGRRDTLGDASPVRKGGSVVSDSSTMTISDRFLELMERQDAAISQLMNRCERLERENRKRCLPGVGDVVGTSGGENVTIVPSYLCADAAPVDAQKIRIKLQAELDALTSLQKEKAQSSQVRKQCSELRMDLDALKSVVQDAMNSETDQRHKSRSATSITREAQTGGRSASPTGCDARSNTPTTAVAKARARIAAKAQAAKRSATTSPSTPRPARFSAGHLTARGAAISAGRERATCRVEASHVTVQQSKHSDAPASPKAEAMGSPRPIVAPRSRPALVCTGDRPQSPRRAAVASGAKDPRSVASPNRGSSRCSPHNTRSNALSGSSSKSPPRERGVGAHSVQVVWRPGGALAGAQPRCASPPRQSRAAVPVLVQAAATPTWAHVRTPAPPAQRTSTPPSIATARARASNCAWSGAETAMAS